MPISLDVIEERLEDRQYATMEKLEGDLKRMVQNAKDYNDSRSEIFQDAERIRKALSNFMPKHNPAYLDPEYRAVPTPIPQSVLEKLRESSVSTSATAPGIKLVMKSRQSLPPSADGDGDTQEEMLSMLEELSTQDNAINFEKRPPKRDYPDYYKLIKEPTSISDIKMMVKQGRVKQWNAFAREVRLIWENAKEYNDPDSAIYEITESLEVSIIMTRLLLLVTNDRQAWFEQQVQAAGAAPPSKGPRLSLSQPKRTQLKLKVGSSTPTPNITGGTVDNESLRRQREEMSQALHRSHRPSSRLGPATPASFIKADSTARSLSSVEPNDVTMGGMNGAHASQAQLQPHAPVSTPLVNGQLPTAVMEGDPPKVNGKYIAQALPPPRNPFAESDNPIERKYRDAGKGQSTVVRVLAVTHCEAGLKDALISSVTYQTHPNLPGDPKWKLVRHASPDRTQTSAYIFLPSNHYYLRVTPELTQELKSRHNYKVCVSVNWDSVKANFSEPGVYDFRLRPGENVIVVDAIAELKDGERKSYAPSQLQIDFERIQLTVVMVASD